jgi:hypothetical protein
LRWPAGNGRSVVESPYPGYLLLSADLFPPLSRAKLPVKLSPSLACSARGLLFISFRGSLGRNLPPGGGQGGYWPCPICRQHNSCSGWMPNWRILQAGNRERCEAIGRVL